MIFSGKALKDLSQNMYKIFNVVSYDIANSFWKKTPVIVTVDEGLYGHLWPKMVGRVRGMAVGEG